MNRDQYIYLVNEAAEQIFQLFNEKAMHGHSVKQDDLINAGISGLKEANEAFDPNMKQPFVIFSRPYIRKAILDMLRNADWTPKTLIKNR